jgi:KDO2-lipid IV(A) lauroyltransferase
MLMEGYPFTMLVKEPKYRAVAKVLRMIQQKHAGQYIYVKPWKSAQRQILKCLRRNEIVCFITDERKRHTGIYVDFFGHPAPTATGPATLSLKTGAPLVPVFIVRDGENSQTIFVEPPLEYNLTGDSSRDTTTVTAAYTKVIEKYVRQYPEQWFWMSKRWKKV